MRVHVVRTIGSLVLAVGSTFVAQPPPAAALVAGTIGFAIALDVPPVGYRLRAVTGNVVIVETTACTDVAAGKLLGGGSVCSFSGSGTLLPSVGGTSCNNFSGYLWGSIRLTNGMNVAFHISIWAAASVFQATGTSSLSGQTGPISMEGIVSSDHDMFTGSCLTDTERRLILVGVSTYGTV